MADIESIAVGAGVAALISLVARVFDGTNKKHDDQIAELRREVDTLQSDLRGHAEWRAAAKERDIVLREQMADMKAMIIHVRDTVDKLSDIVTRRQSFSLGGE